MTKNRQMHSSVSTNRVLALFALAAFLMTIHVTRGSVVQGQTLQRNTEAQNKRNPLIDALDAAFGQRNPAVSRVAVLELRAYGPGAGPYVLLGWGIRPDLKFEGRFDDELFGVFLVDPKLTRVDRTLEIIPTPRWFDYMISIDRLTPDELVVVGAGTTYGDQPLRRKYDLKALK